MEQGVASINKNPLGWRHTRIHSIKFRTVWTLNQNQRDSQEGYLVWNAVTEHGRTGMDQHWRCVFVTISLWKWGLTASGQPVHLTLQTVVSMSWIWLKKGKWDGRKGCQHPSLKSSIVAAQLITKAAMCERKKTSHVHAKKTELGDADNLIMQHSYFSEFV